MRRCEIIPHTDGWAVRQPGSLPSTSVYATQSAARFAAHASLLREGGGELVVRGIGGEIRLRQAVRTPRRRRTISPFV